MTEEVCNERVDWRAVAGFVERVVSEGRYGSASEVVREGLRLVEEREAKLLALRAALDDSIARGGEVTDAELDAALGVRSAELTRKGVGE
jgi:antitoxin ParD1/3/4